MKIVCLGYFERGNSGDEAFKYAHEWLFGADNIEFAKGRLDAEWIAGRPVILGGGDVVAPFFLDWIPEGCEFHMLGVGLKYEEASLRAMREKGQALRFCWLRNRIDVELARAAGFACEYVPDIVYSLRDAVEPLPAEVEKQLGRIGRAPYAVVCLADHFNSRYELTEPSHNAYLEYFKWELARILDELAQEVRIVFLPLSVYTNHQDARMHHEVAARMTRSDRVDHIEASLTPIQAIGVVRRSSLVVSMKLHGNIYGLATKRPCVNIGVGRKQQLLYSEAGLDDCSIHPGELSQRTFFNALEAARSEPMRRRVSELSDQNFAALTELRTALRARFELDAPSQVEVPETSGLS
jgi:polysaccharide pyruvyl transferase WcaK-like protein